MSHQIEADDQMMYAGQVPWHGLGIFVGDNAVDSATAIQAAGLDWKVKRVPMVAKITHERTGEVIEASTDEYYGIVRNKDCKVLGVVQGRYNVIQNEECFEFMDTVAGPTADVRYHTAGSLRGGKRVWMLAKLENHYIEPVKGDLTESYMLLSTSHDGSSSVHILWTGVRVVCSNTLAMAVAGKAKAGIKIRHTGNLEDKIKKAREILGLVIDQHDQYKEVTEYLARLSINTERANEFIDKVMPLPEGRKTTRAQNARDKVMELYESGLGTDIPGVRGTGWGMFNAYTEYLNHHMTYRNTAGNTAQDNRLNSLWYGKGAASMDQAKKALLEFV